MTLWQRIEAHPYRYLFLSISVYIVINNTVNAFSVWSDHNRAGIPKIEMWEPFVWEYSSAMSTLFLLPVLMIMFRLAPLKLSRLKTWLFTHFIASIGFSVCHVGIMVAIRKVYYWSVGASYEFGPWLNELFYEYRKDAWGYFCWLILFSVFNALLARIKGEANMIANNEESENSTADFIPEHFLVKKLDKEFLVKVTEIEWLESAGNYVNLHSNGRIYPLRTTLTELCQRLETVGFSRVHRSYGLNHNAIESIQYFASGDGEITLKNKQKLTLSRRYKDEFKQKFS